MKNLVIYHKNCHDGFGAAWVAYLFLKQTDTEYLAMNHGETPPDVTGKNVYVLDFSFDRETCFQLYDQADNFIILDHHKSAYKNLKACKFAYFDMERSGAGLTWDYFQEKPDQAFYYPVNEKISNSVNRPPMINYIENRDLWKNDLPKAKEVTSFLFSLPYDFESWDIADNAFTVESAATAGQHILEYQNRVFDRIVDMDNLNLREIEGHLVPVTNATTLQSEIGSELAKSYPFSVTYMIRPNKVFVSFRSTDEGVDVSEIASKWGGGGHRNAAGCKWTYNELMDALGGLNSTPIAECENKLEKDTGPYLAATY